MEFKLDEIFNSIEGEFPKAGIYSTFIRFPKCNYSCHWCFGQDPITKHIPSVIEADTGVRIPITDINLGKYILTLDDRMKLTKTKVVATAYRDVSDYIRFNANNVYYCVTKDHLIFTQEGLKEANDLKEGDEIIAPEGNIIKVKEKRYVSDSKLRVYNIKCSPYDTYLIDNMYVHNCDTIYRKNYGPKPFLLDEILALVKKSKALTFTGGEPSLFLGDIEKILDEIIKHEIYLQYVKIETNGSMLGRLDKFLREKYYDLFRLKYDETMIISWSPKFYNKEVRQISFSALYDEYNPSNMYIKLVADPKIADILRRFISIVKEQYGTAGLNKLALMPLSITKDGEVTGASDKASIELVKQLVEEFHCNVTLRYHEAMGVR